MQKLLSPYGESHIAVNGREAIEEFEQAIKDKNPYDLICLDIMMPEIDGFQALKEIRKIEEQNRIFGPDAVKIIMTTSVDNPKNIMEAFNAQCEAYLIKPIDRTKIIEHMQKLGFLA